MKRRDFFLILAMTALCSPHALAQSAGSARRLGILLPGPSGMNAATYADLVALRQALGEFGWSDGGNLQIDIGYGAGDSRTEAAASAIVARSPEVILADAAPGVRPLMRLTSTIPIVFVNVQDPVSSRFIQSTDHPGGNVTGVVSVGNTVGGQWVEILKEIVPGITRIATLYNPQLPAVRSYMPLIREAAARLSIELVDAQVHVPGDLSGAIRSVASVPNSGLIVIPDVLNNVNRSMIADLAVDNRLPAIFYFPTGGGLVSYGVDTPDMYHRAARFIDQILRGANPGDLPTETSPRLDLIVNQAVARALGIVLPQSVLDRAERVENENASGRGVGQPRRGRM